MTLSETAFSGGAATLLGQWGKFTVQAAAIIILSRILDPRDFGIYAMTAVVVGLALLLSDFGLSLATVQADNISDQLRSNVFWINVLSGTVCALVVVLLAGPIALFYEEPLVRPLLYAVSAMFILNSAYAQYTANASRELRFRHLAVAEVTAQACGLIAAIIAGMAGWGYWALAMQQLSASFVMLMVLVIQSRWFPQLPRAAEPLAPLLRFGKDTLGVQLLNYATNNADSLLLGRFSGAAALGLYDRAFQIFKVPMQQIAAPLTRVALPLLSRVKDTPRFGEVAGSAQTALTWSLGSVFAVAAVAAEPGIEILLGDRWSAAVPLFTILCFAGMLQAMGYGYYWVFLAKGLTGLQFRYSLITRIIGVLLIVLGTLWGALGVSLAVALGNLINWLVLTLFALPKAEIKIRGVIARGVLALSTFGIMLLSGFALRPLWHPLNVWFQLLACVLLALVVEAVLVAIVPLSRRDFQELHSLLRKAFK